MEYIFISFSKIAVFKCIFIKLPLAIFGYNDEFAFEVKILCLEMINVYSCILFTIDLYS